jgi:hypothetical protein
MDILAMTNFNIKNLNYIVKILNLSLIFLLNSCVTFVYRIENLDLIQNKNTIDQNRKIPILLNFENDDNLIRFGMSQFLSSYSISFLSPKKILKTYSLTIEKLLPSPIAKTSRTSPEFKQVIHSTRRILQ